MLRARGQQAQAAPASPPPEGPGRLATRALCPLPQPAHHPPSSAGFCPEEAGLLGGVSQRKILKTPVHAPPVGATAQLSHRRRGVAGLGSRHRPGLRGGPAQGGQESTGQGASTPDLRGWSMSIPWGLGQVPPRPQDFLSGGARPRPAGGAPQP